MAGVVLSSIISFLFPAKRGQTEDCPLPLTALPGLMTFLDVALFRSMEGQLTATICSSHTLLACWLDVKHQAQLVLQLLKQDDDNQRHSSSHDQQQQQDKSLVESLARQCLDAACDAIERLSTDRLASAGNLSDPYDSTAAASSGGGGHHHGHHGSHGHQAMTSGVGVQGIANGILESKEETGRRQPMQRRSDCWESPRLYCPDYVWADDVCSACQRWIRNLDKHPLVMKNSVDAITTLASPAPTGGGGGKIGAKGGGGGSGGGGAASALDIAIHGDSCLGPETDRQAGLLVQLIEDDLPIRLYQFRQAMEAEAVVTKRLYLVKCEYRAPFRAFLEAHQSLLRAPPMQLVDDYLEQHDKANQGDRKSAENHGDGESLEALKSKLQKLLNAPELVELLALEMEAETLELDMGEALFPFSELARSLDHKRARLKVVPGVVDPDELPVLQETVRRLKYVLCRKGGPETSSGIRPILLDLLLIPRDDEPRRPTSFPSRSSSSSSPYAEFGTLEERVDFFLSQLSTLSTLVHRSKNAFASAHPLPLSSTSGGGGGGPGPSPTPEIDFSPTVVRGCTDGHDPELLRCRLLDWFDVVDRQHELLLLHWGGDEVQGQPSSSSSSSPGGPAEEIRRAEMTMSVAGASPQSLLLVRERLASIRLDREQRLDVLREMVQEVCLREMNLYVRLEGPDPRQALELREVPSAQGFLGAPLGLAGEALPLG